MGQKALLNSEETVTSLGHKENLEGHGTGSVTGPWSWLCLLGALHGGLGHMTFSPLFFSFLL